MEGRKEGKGKGKKGKTIEGTNGYKSERYFI